MLAYRGSPQEILRSLIANRSLILDLTKREAVGRYRGSVMGVAWSLVTPLLMLAVYTFVFSEIFKARWGDSSATRGEFAILLFAGLILFNIFAECISRAPSLIIGNANYVKRVVFPLEILPVTILGSALFHACVSVTVLLIFELFVKGSVPPTALQLPVLVFPYLLFVLGATWWLAALGVYLRDIAQTINILITALMFLSPIFFPLHALSPRWQKVAQLNPLTFPIEQTRNVLFWGESLNWAHWAPYLGIAALFCWSGFFCFQRIRRGFADVL